MAAIKICAIADGAAGPLLGPFTIESSDPDTREPVVANLLRFNRWVANGMTFYGSKGGVENSSLFKSYAIECFEELAQDEPATAASLTDLVIICSGLPSSLDTDPFWQLHRAILATLPGVQFR